MIDYALDKNNKALELHEYYQKFFNDLFIDTNPIPVKYASSVIGLSEEVYRLPLCSMKEEKKEILLNTMRELGVL